MPCLIIALGNNFDKILQPQAKSLTVDLTFSIFYGVCCGAYYKINNVLCLYILCVIIIKHK